MPRAVHLISSPAGFGGAEAVMMALLEGGAERGWEQAVLNPFARSTGEELAERCAGFGYEALPARGARPLAAPAALRWTRRRLAELRPDVLQVYLAHALVLAAALPRSGAGETRVLSHQHGMHFEAAERGAAARLDRLAGRRFDHVVACSESVRDYLLESYRYPPRRVTCIRNGWQGTPLERRPDEQPTIVCTANFSAEKGHATLIEAFATVAGRVPAARLVLLGRGAELERTRARAAELGIAERVELAGFQESIWPWLARAHAFVLPSNYESLGIAVLEAMAAGLPVVATRVGGIAELVRPGVSGELVPTGDPEAMAAALCSVLADPAAARRMGEAGRAAAEQERMSACVERYYDLYERLLAERRVAA
jgi:glycosyltransferase involved in cell wall biosynthesis